MMSHSRTVKSAGSRTHISLAGPVQVEKLAIALERLRGALEGANLADNCVVYDAVQPCLPALLHARHLFAAQPLLQQLLLQLGTALASAHSGTLHHDAAEVRTCSHTTPRHATTS